jgi:hypothetical protein
MADFAKFLRNYRRVVMLALAGAGLCALIGALVLFLRAPSERIGTTPFRLLFESAAQDRYPNGTVFSPTEIVAPPVLREVFQANNLQRFGEYKAFEQSMFILGANPAGKRLVDEYQARLGDTRLTPVNRARIEEEFRTKRLALIDPVFSVNLRTGRALAALPPELVEKVLRDTLATWAEHAYNRKGATRYNIPILSKDILDRAVIEREDYFIAIDILRAKTYRVIATIETLGNLPGGQLIRIGEQKLSLAEIRSNLEDVIRFRLEPLLDLIRSEGITKNPGALRQYANNQLFQLRLEREQSLSLVRSLQRAIDLYTTQRSSATRDLQHPGVARGTATAAPVTSQMDQSFLDRLMSFATAADDQEYRRKLTDRIIEEGERAGTIQREEAYYQDLAQNLRAMDARSSGSPAAMALIKTRTTQAFDEVSKAAADVSAVYDELSVQNLRASTPLYTTTGPHVLRTRRSVSVSALVLLVFLLFVLTFVAMLAGGVLHHRLTRL